MESVLNRRQIIEDSRIYYFGDPELIGLLLYQSAYSLEACAVAIHASFLIDNRNGKFYQYNSPVPSPTRLDRTSRHRFIVISLTMTNLVAVRVNI